jgi:hypothetical protein
MSETITAKEVGEVLAMAAARDQRTVGDGDVLAWYDDLNEAGLTFQDARRALSRFYVQQASIPADRRFRATTPDVIELARKIRRERVANVVYEPLPGQEETGADFVRRYRAQLDAVGSGRMDAPTERPMLTGGPAPELIPLLRGMLQAVPEEDAAEAAAPVRPVAVGAMTVACPRPECGAHVGQKCKFPTGKLRPKPHPARELVARGGTWDPEAERAEEERRRAASAAALKARTEAAEALAALPDPEAAPSPETGEETPSAGNRAERDAA